ncbi:MAG: AraC family transcriptional regulator [Lachnospiraceae bacterium]|nr:AraC family transcriptional regulator [Lachnospiraceae bacterium]
MRQIGEAVGYPEQGYFSRIFKKATGLSPLEYRDRKET